MKLKTYLVPYLEPYLSLTCETPSNKEIASHISYFDLYCCIIAPVTTGKITSEELDPDLPCCLQQLCIRTLLYARVTDFPYFLQLPRLVLHLGRYHGSSSNVQTRSSTQTSCGLERAIRLLLPLRCEDIPKAKGFVSRTGAHCGPVWAGGKMQDTRSVTFELFHASHGWILPQTQLVLRKSMAVYDE